MRLEDVDALRRSLAIGGTLTRGDTERLLDTCQQLLEQQAAIVGVLGRLGPTFRETRSAPNELRPDRQSALTPLGLVCGVALPVGSARRRRVRTD